MVVDGVRGFTGGMNIREGCVLKNNPRHPFHDLHFKVEGPIVTHLQETFLTDWAFATGELLDGEKWMPIPEYQGDTLARGIVDGPDENFEKLLMTILAAIATANERIVIMTPYFLPTASMIRALNVAALRDIDVSIIFSKTETCRPVLLVILKWNENIKNRPVYPEGSISISIAMR